MCKCHTMTPHCKEVYLLSYLQYPQIYCLFVNVLESSLALAIGALNPGLP